jgi:hypothetical protein
MKLRRVCCPTDESNDLLDKLAPQFRHERMHRTTEQRRHWTVRSPRLRAAVVFPAERVRG